LRQQKSSNGTTYIIGSDVKISHIEKILQKQVLYTLFSVSFYFILMIPIGTIYIRILKNDKKILEERVILRTKELQESKERVEKLNKDILDSIEYASLIQNSLIPDKKVLDEFFHESFVFWKPKNIVGGDIYLIEKISDDEVVIMVIDCTGHGVPGAFVTMLVKALEMQIMANINKDRSVDPASILTIFNRNMKNILKQNQNRVHHGAVAGFDGGIIYFNKEDKLLRFAGAKTPLFYTYENEIKTLKGDRSSVGYFRTDPNFQFKNHQIEIKDGMSFYLTTDGYLDQNGGEKGFSFGRKEFQRLILENMDRPLSEQLEIFKSRLEEYQGDYQTNDDITILAFKS
jgi:serine phosphatase RsbU (regulator of sigma subunit)